MNPNVLITDEKYCGKYVALSSFRSKDVVASGDDPIKVIESARAKGIECPVVFYCPAKGEEFIYNA